ncbi:hypothetical protein CPB84DRAFT_1964966 [Gymnopilus junonius]|uniref:HTH cro/C1-type domain-containing protein n=1 Tax=Gymnopilus junonius TaxID=109634 RepID=A0A9P5NG08_GYMJU|nr:hypothetical protein CPB84DRAFT_1964966 [Gymnopilus junonius]
MAPDPRCTALAAVMQKQGVTYAQLATKIGTNEKHVTDVLTGSSRPTDAEFKAIATALGLTDVPHTGVHSTA